MNITPSSLSIAQLLGAENEQYCIPAYQRRYSWKRHQVEDLWDDVRLLGDTDTHLLGTIVCLTGPHRAGINRLELVDGQQRLTTIAVLLHCLLARLKQEGQAADAQDLGRLLTARAFGQPEQPKIALDSLDARQFKQHTLGEKADPLENERLADAFTLISDWLQELSLQDMGALLYRLKNQAVIIRLDVGNAKDAFKLFETINNRGLRLSPTDIIKNFILGNAARFDADSLELAKDQWARVIRHLDGIVPETFFRQYMVARLGRRVTKSQVVEEFQKAFMREVTEAESLPDRHYYGWIEAEDDTDDDDSDLAANTSDDLDDDDEEQHDVRPRVDFKSFIGDLVDFSRTYRNVVRAETGVPGLDRRLRNLRLIRAQQSYGFLTTLLAKGCERQTFDEVLRLTEIFLLRRHITRERTNDNETVFARLCTVDAANPLPDVRAAYREYLPSDNRFKQEFLAADFPSRLMDRARYCLEQFELSLQGDHFELAPAGPDSVHVEHIIPQKITTKKAKKRYGDWVTYLGADAIRRHQRYVARIGNLTLFAGDLNIAASNHPYERKKPAHASSAFKLTKSLPHDYPEFRFEEVEARSQKLAELAVRLWPAI